LWINLSEGSELLKGQAIAKENMSIENLQSILIVDDEISCAKSGKEVLERSGYQVHIANNSEQALKFLENNPFIDLILMDINLGMGMDSSQTAEIILAEREIPLIFLFSHNEPGVDEKIERITSYGYVYKDAKPTVLLASIKMGFRLFGEQQKVKRQEQEILAREASLRESESRYRAMFENMAAASCVDEIIYHNGKAIDYRILDINPAFERITGIKHQDIIGALASQVYGMEKAPFLDIYSRVAETGEPADFEAFFPPIQKYLHITAGCPKPGFFSTVFTDITNTKTYQQRIEDINRFLKAIDEVNRLLAQEQDIPALMQGACDLLQNNRQYLNIEISLIDPMTSLLQPMAGAGEHGLREWQSTLEGDGDAPLCIKKALEDKCTLTITDKENIYFACPYFLEDNRHDTILTPIWLDQQLVGLLCACLIPGYQIAAEEIGLLEDVAHDLGFAISKKQTEIALRQSEQRFKLVFENANIGLYRTTPSGQILLANPYLLEMLDYSTFEELSQRNLNQESFEPDYPRQDFQMRIEREGKIVGLESAWVRRDGSILYVRENARAIRDQAGKTLYYEGSVEDITQLKQAELALRHQLEEKDIILKEAHHRIKNNIASLEALLTFKADAIKQVEARKALQEAISRISSMRILYEKLLLASQFQQSSTRSYLDELTQTIIYLFPQSDHIKFEYHFDDCQLDSKQLFYLGIVLNELLTNIMKYAFIDQESGLVRINLIKQTDHLSLTIQDNGVGLPADLDKRDVQGFGLILAKMVSKQLCGSFQMESKNGLKSTLEIPI
jgi:PAS domain S-box-containing protein